MRRGMRSGRAGAPVGMSGMVDTSWSGFIRERYSEADDDQAGAATLAVCPNCARTSLVVAVTTPRLSGSVLACSFHCETASLTKTVR